MSLITCCPACGTMFKVVADQLRISEGWVRCGHCTEVFDATAHLQAPGAMESAQVALPPSSRPEPSEPSRAEPLDPPADPAVAPDTAAVPASQAPAASPAPAPAPVPTRDPAESAYPPFELRRLDDSDIEVGYSILPQEVDSSWGTPERPDSTPLSPVGFVRQAQRKAFWRRPGVRLVLVVVALGLLALLAAQVAVHERDRLAALRPGLKPLLQALCQPLACTVGPMKRIDAVSIDSSTFNKLRPDLYRLNFSLKNQGRLEVAMPALQLTLTDVQDQPVVQRVLMQREFGANADVIAAGAEWSGSILVSVNANGTAARIAGYRLLAFYP